MRSCIGQSARASESPSCADSRYKQFRGQYLRNYTAGANSIAVYTKSSIGVLSPRLRKDILPEGRMPLFLFAATRYTPALRFSWRSRRPGEDEAPLPPGPPSTLFSVPASILQDQNTPRKRPPEPAVKRSVVEDNGKADDVPGRRLDAGAVQSATLPCGPRNQPQGGVNDEVFISGPWQQ